MSENIKITILPAAVQQVALKTSPTTHVTTGPVTVVQTGGGVGGNAFGIVNVTGQNNIVATIATDTLRVVQGSGISLTTDSPNNALTINATGGAAQDQFARDTANSAFAKANVANTTAEAGYTKANTANVTGEAAYAKANAANILAQASFVQANLAFDRANTFANASNITSGTLAVARGGTGQTTYSNGDLLIGNTISGGLDRANLTAGVGIVITNGPGTVTIDAAVGRTYYLVLSQASNIATYNVASTSPSPGVETSTSAVFTGTSYSLTAVFATEPGQPGTTLLPAGTYGRHFHATTDGLNNEAQLRVDLYKYAANGLETLLRTNESPIFNSGNASVLLAWNITDATNYALDVTDRLVFKTYARRVSGGSGSVQITIYYEGSSRASYIPTTILTVAADDVARAMAAAAFAKANAANILAQAAFTQANTANVTGEAAFAKANTANVTGEAAFAKANTANVTGQAAFDKANLANTLAQSSYDKANTAIYTQAQIRANISNTAPINYDSTTGIISHATSGVVATGYANSNTIPVLVVDNKGHLTGVTNTAIGNLDAAAITTGNLVIARGGTGRSLTGVTSGQLLIGNTTNSGFDLNTLANTGSGGILVTNGPGTITLGANVIWVRGNVSNTTPVLYDPATGIFSHKTSGITATGYGTVNQIPVLVVDDKGHLTSVVNTAIGSLDTANITTGTLVVARGGTGQTSYANGEILIGNTTSGGLDKRTLTQGTGILITNGNGRITIDATGGSATDQYARDKANGAVQLGYPKINVAANATLVAATTNNDTLILIQGSGILLTPNAGNSSIVISATGGAAVDQYARDKANGAVQLGYPRINVASNATLVSAVTNNDILVLLAGTNVVLASNAAQSSITISSFDQYARDLANTANTTADAAFANANNSIKTSAQIRANISNAYPVYYSSTTGVISFVPATANGQLLIGNTVSGSFDLNTLANTGIGGILITNDKGSITLAANVIWVRGNISATTPISYAPATGIITHATSGVTATGYGSATQIPVVVVDDKGHLTSIVNTAIAGLDAGVITTGRLTVPRGGTGLTPTITNGAILIGNTVNSGFDLNTIANTGTGGILITNGQGTITLAANVIWVRGNVSNTAPINYDPATGIFSHALSGIVATNPFGTATLIPKITVDDKGHITAVTNTAIAGLDAGVITTGSLVVARGGTGLTPTIANGAILIGNTVNSGFDLNTIANTGTGGILITNGQGTITLAANVIWMRGNLSAVTPITYTAANGGITHAGSGVVATGYGTAAQIPVFVVNETGHVTSVTNTAIAGLDAGVITTGRLVVARGGTGLTPTVANGALLIGNTVNSGFDLNTIANTGTGGILITNGQGTITLAANVIWVRGNVSNTTPILYDPSTGIFSHKTSGVSATIYGGANTVPVVTIDTFGHVTLAANSSINNLDASTITTGNLVIARGGTGRSLTGVTNGQLLIGNTTNGGFDLATLTQGTNITITNGNGTITIASAGGASGNGWGVVNIGGTGNANINSSIANDTLKVVAGAGIILSTDPANDTLTITATGGAATDQFARDTANSAWLQANTANAIANSISGGVSMGLIDAYVRGYGITMQ